MGRATAPAAARRAAPSALAAALALALALLPPVSPAEDEEVLVCPSCGAEAALSARFCSACGSALDASAPPPSADLIPAGETAPAPADTGASASAFDPAAAVGAVSAADAAAAAAASKSVRNPAFTLAAVRDTLRAAAVFPGTLPDSAFESLSAAAAEALAALSAPVSEKCPVCGGAAVVAAPKPVASSTGGASGVSRLEDSSVTRTAPQLRVKCGFCSGSGTMPRVRDRAAVLAAVRFGAAAFARAAEARGRVEEHGVHWRASDAAAMREPARASAAKAALKSLKGDCDKCAGTGTVRCDACGGWGRVKCASPFHGAARVEAGSAGIRPAASRPYVRIEDAMMSPSSSVCPACGGAAASPGFVRCPECSGRGLAACRTCGGSGHAK